MSHASLDDTEMDSVSYDFVAIRGIQAGREFYVAMCPMKTIPKLFIFNDEELPAELRAQRTLNKARVPQIADYIINNPKEYLFSSLTASVDGKMKFAPFQSEGPSGKVGKLYISMSSRLLINDGQHRRAAIEEALKERPDLGNETISVVFFQDRGLKRSQQMFSDLNKHAMKPTRSLGILYDQRDKFSQFIVQLSYTVSIFRGRTELEKTSISNRSTKFFTLNGISQATKALLKSHELTEESKKLAIEFWEEVCKNIPEWRLLVEKKVVPSELRKEYVHAHTNIHHALGIAGNILINEYPTDWKKRLQGLRKIDWLRSNKALWEGRIMIGGTMSKTRNAVELAANVFLKACGVSLTPEREMVEKKNERGKR